MRDTNRIPHYCSRLAELWDKVPDWRFSQFMENILIAWKNTYKHDAFYAEDEDFFAFVETYLKEI